MGTENIVFPYEEIICGFKKEGNMPYMDEPWGHYAKWNMLVTERQVLHNSTYLNIENNQILGIRVEWWGPEAGERQTWKVT